MITSEEVNQLTSELLEQLQIPPGQPMRRGIIPRPALIGPDYGNHLLGDYLLPRRSLPRGKTPADQISDDVFAEIFYGYIYSYFIAKDATEHPFNFIHDQMAWSVKARKAMFPRRSGTKAKANEILEGLATMLWSVGTELTYDKDRLIAHLDCGDVGIEKNRVVFTDNELDAAFIPDFDWKHFLTSNRSASPASQPETFEIWLSASMSGDMGATRAAQVLAYTTREQEGIITAQYHVGVTDKEFRKSIRDAYRSPQFMTKLGNILHPHLLSKSKFTKMFKREIFGQEYLVDEDKERILITLSSYLKFNLN